MKSFCNLLLASAIVSTALAQYRTDLSAGTFYHWPWASEYAGSPVKVDLYTTTKMDVDLYYMHMIKPVVMRLADVAIDFTPHLMVASGTHPNVNCRNPDGSALETYRSGCWFHCLNHGRYCNAQSMINPADTQQTKEHSTKAHTFLVEDARRYCLWKTYGEQRDNNELYRFFQYQDAFHGMGCSHDKYHFTDACAEQAMLSVDFDYQTVSSCVGEMSDRDEPSEVFEDMLARTPEVQRIPAFFVHGAPVDSFYHLSDKHADTRSNDPILKMVCDAMTDPKPEVCNFCLNWCPGKVAGLFDMNTCLWELKCGDDTTSFQDYLQELGLEAPPDGQPQGPQPLAVANSETGEGAAPADNAEGQSQPIAPEENAAPIDEPLGEDTPLPMGPTVNNQDAETPGVDGDSEAPNGSATLMGSVATASTASSESSSSSSTTTGLSVMATMLAVVLLAGFTSLAVMAIRVWRTKMIIDRYVREQQAMNGGGDYYTDHGHRDPKFFPEDNELDLDVEPALQYSEHVKGTGRASPPQQASFLPQLT